MLTCFFSPGWLSSHHTASLLADAVAVAADTLYSLPCGRPRGHTHEVAVIHHFLGGAHICRPHKVACDQASTSWHTSAVLQIISAVQFSFSSVTQSCPTLCDPMNYSTPGLPVHHQLLEFTQTHVHRVSDAIQPSHPLSSPSPPAPNPSQRQCLFQWVNSSHEVAKVLEFQL